MEFISAWHENIYNKNHLLGRRKDENYICNLVIDKFIFTHDNNIYNYLYKLYIMLRHTNRDI